MRRVSIHVGRLVLDGLPEGRRRAIGETVERELARLALAPGGPLQVQPGRPVEPAAVARAAGDRLSRAISGKGGKNRP